ncbi:low molecular weight protein-tyrosine-phosphatase [Compostibacter hankyongensis]|uniref:protein-tyrosine-phosphatase n=1 Tax=Compostibacter hankyongensis TaxID=1007089 RepID=A0ABP8FGH3_9BACT
MKILMVCLGNICRSPMAEGILREKVRIAGLDWEIDSAGTESYHVGEAPHPLARKVARLHGIDISGLRARRMTKSDFGYFDKIYAMATDVCEEMQAIGRQEMDMQKVDLLLNLLYPGENRSVPDPWYGTEPDFHSVYTLLDSACSKMVASYVQAAGS